MERYQPGPIDTSSVELPAEVHELMEQLAENTHEVWAQQRMKQGWTFGPRRDDEARKHPCLVPYAQLAEADKELDRQTAIQTLKLILALGYRIVPPNRT
jgi:ryanodine receptor 2